MTRLLITAVTSLFLALAPIALASSTWYVDGVNGSDSNSCTSSQSACKTIGHAISLAASGDSIMVAAATYHEGLTINISLTVIGSDAHTTVIDSGHTTIPVTVSNAAANVKLAELTIQNGGPGVYNIGTLEITDSTVRNNFIRRSCFNYCLGLGAGIRNLGVITITNSTIANNSIHVSCSQASPPLCIASGGGISNEGGHVAIINSTLSGNSVYGTRAGQPIGTFGAIRSTSPNSITISSSTIAGNSANWMIGGIATTVISNSIVANNVGGNCYGSPVSKGYNISSDGTCNFSNSGDLNNHDPLLGPLQNNGGPTDSMALLSGSPAIDAGNPAGCTDNQGLLLKTDQRGMPRPDKEDSVGCDMGAYESQND